MSRCTLLLLLLLPWAAVADSLSLARQYLEMGLPRLALARVERDQPANPFTASWLEWESLRLTLLAETHQPARLLERVAGLPQDLPADFRQKALGHAAWAHLELNQAAAARARLARLLWTFPLSPENQQWARRLVIRSWLAEHRPDEAYRAMLRYQQDFAPLPREVAAEFVRGLLGEGRPAEALTWLKSLDPASPLAVWASLEAGLIPPEEAAVRAEAELARAPQAADWVRVLAAAARKAGDPLRSLEALEREAAAGSPEHLNALWQAYADLGAATGNRAQLLQGDDGAWLALGAGLAGTEPLRARAVYATLTHKGVAPETRESAKQRLFALLAQAGRGEVAARLLAAAPWARTPPAPEAGMRLALDAAALLPPDERVPVLLAAARYGELAGRLDLAADAAVQAVLAGDLRHPDVEATKALKTAMDYLARAGFEAEAPAFYQRVVALRAPAAAPAKTPPRAATRRRP